MVPKPVAGGSYTAGPVGAVEGLPGRRAACLDLENIAITVDGRVSRTQMQVLLGVIGAHVHGIPVRVATASGVLRAYMDLIHTQRWGLSLVGQDPDAADIALIEAAQGFIKSGVTDLVVISGDHRFTSLASRTRLHVISHADHLSRRLRLAATTVTLLPALTVPLAVA